MNTKVLVTYTTMSGSTVEIARTVADNLDQDGISVDFQPISLVADLSHYDAVVLGAPMILGWHRDMVSFIVKNQDTLKNMPVAYFTTQLNLTNPLETELNGVTVFLDPKLAKTPTNPDRMNMPLQEKQKLRKSWQKRKPRQFL